MNNPDAHVNVFGSIQPPDNDPPASGRGAAIMGRQPSDSEPPASGLLSAVEGLRQSRTGVAIEGLEDPGRFIPAERVPWLFPRRPAPVVHVVHHIIVNQESDRGEDRHN